MNFSKKLYAAVFALGVMGIVPFSQAENNWWWPFGESEKTTHHAELIDQPTGEVLLVIDGQPALTADEYEAQLEMARQSNPQVDALLNMMPNAEKEFVFKGVATGQLMKAWGKKEGIHQTGKFKNELKQLHDAMELQLFMKYFDEAHPVQVSDSDLKKFYDEKKDVIPGLQTSPGGVHVSYVRFDSKDKAQDFLAKAKEAKTKKEFEDKAKEHNVATADDTVNAKSHLSDAIKSVVADVKKFPSAHMAKVGDNSYWVLHAHGKSDAKYHDFNLPQVQQGLKKMLSDERKEKQLEETIEKLKKELNVVENSKYFEDKENKKRAALEDAAKAHDMSSQDVDKV